MNATTARVLTGIPQIDYIWDPNLPRELNGFNLSEYPFYSSIPEEIDFKCDGLHDGFYASVPHKCQVIKIVFQNSYNWSNSSLNKMNVQTMGKKIAFHGIIIQSYKY